MVPTGIFCPLRAIEINGFKNMLFVSFNAIKSIRDCIVGSMCFYSLLFMLTYTFSLPLNLRNCTDYYLYFAWTISIFTYSDEYKNVKFEVTYLSSVNSQLLQDDYVTEEIISDNYPYSCIPLLLLKWQHQCRARDISVAAYIPNIWSNRVDIVENITNTVLTCQ